MATRHIARLLAIELAALGEATFVQVAALQIMTAGSTTHVAGALGVLRLLGSWTDAWLLEGQGAGTTDTVVIAGLHHALVEWRALRLTRLLTTQKRPYAVLDGQGQSGGAIVGQGACLFACGQRWTWLRLALHFLQLTGLSIGTLETIARIPTATHRATCLRIACKSRRAEHATRRGGTMSWLLALNATSSCISCTRQLYAILINAPAILASFFVCALNAFEFAALATTWNPHSSCRSIRLQSLGSSRLRTSQMLAGC